MTRFVPVTVLMVMLAASRGASAQSSEPGGLPNGATLVFEHLKVQVPGTMELIEPEVDKRPLYFNLAHCTCAKSGADKFQYLVRETTTSGIHQPVYFWVGQSCATDNTQRINNCKQVSSINDVDSLYPGGSPQDFNLYAVVNGKLHDGAECQQIEGAATIWGFVSTTGSTDTFDYSTTVNVGTLPGETSTINGVDTKPPPAPTDLTASPNEGAIDLSWTPPTSNNTDIAYYQALCAKLDGTPARSQAADPQFVTTASVCPGVPADLSEQLTKVELDNGEMAVGLPDPETDFGGLNESYICGEANSGTAKSLQIKGLENGTPYQVILLAVDRHGNYTGLYLDHTITPHLVTDFWEDLHDRGSHTEGGLCLLAETYGDDSGLTSTLRAFRDETLGGSRLGRWLSDAYYATLARLGAHVHGSTTLHIIAAVVLAPVVAFALLWHWLTLPGVLGLIAAAWWWRRRRAGAPRRGLRLLRTRAAHLVAGVAVLTLGASRARAGGYQPYWEDTEPTPEENKAAADEPGLVKWHAGIRVGPYIPDIDKQLGVNPGPYEQMFGGYRVLPMLDVDRILWTGFGQVGVGGTIGYMQKTAHAFAMNTDPTMTDRPREPGATNTFRLIPFALTATYRFTWLDDELGVPLVPYARGGLSYYVWWVNAPNGSFAQVCKDGGMEPDCGQNKALGASLGVQGSIGLAIRAERIDRSAATSMRQSGIEHAGLYGELSLAKVDGFGSDTKLSVGDRTWFAGVDFEF